MGGVYVSYCVDGSSLLCCSSFSLKKAKEAGAGMLRGTVSVSYFNVRTLKFGHAKEYETYVRVKEKHGA